MYSQINESIFVEWAVGGLCSGRREVYRVECNSDTASEQAATLEAGSRVGMQRRSHPIDTQELKRIKVVNVPQSRLSDYS